MKNKSSGLLFILLSLLASCSALKFSGSTQEVRTVASLDFECAFEETIDGQKSHFIFTPNNFKMTVTNEKYGTETLFLEEDNFLSGGFSYIQDKVNQANHWPVKTIEFLSFTKTPKVTVHFQRTPASEKEKTITKFCE